MRQSRNSFFCGAVCGAAVSIAALILVGYEPAIVEATHAEAHSEALQYEPGDYFVTGYGNEATLWRRERNGTLTCVSTNTCRQPRGE